MAELAVHDKHAGDACFEWLLLVIKQEAGDSRNIVKKAVNWALRQIGKRSPALRLKPIAWAREIARLEVRSARWIMLSCLVVVGFGWMRSTR